MESLIEAFKLRLSLALSHIRLEIEGTGSWSIHSLTENRDHSAMPLNHSNNLSPSSNQNIETADVINAAFDSCKAPGELSSPSAFRIIHWLGELHQKTLDEALTLVVQEFDNIIKITVERLQRDLNDYVPNRLQSSVLARRSLVELWPWPFSACAAGKYLSALLSCCKKLPLGEPRPGAWPGEAAPLDVAIWISNVLERRTPGLGKQLLQQARDADTFLRTPNSDLIAAAQLFLIVREIEKGLRSHAIAVDAGKTHHSFLTGWRDLPKDARYKHTFDRDDSGSVVLLPPGGAVQLLLPGIVIDSRIVRTLRDWRGYLALRIYAALLRLLSEAGRTGWMRWTLDQHMRAMGYRERSRKNPELRARIAREVELLTTAELVEFDPSGRERHRAPVLNVSSKTDRLEAGNWTLGFMELRINPCLYKGVRNPKTHKIGRNWYPAPTKVPEINHARCPYAIILGLILPIRFRLASGNHLPISGNKLLTAAGIKHRRNNPARAWAALERTLMELKKAGLLEGWKWDQGQENTLDGICRLYPALWLTDRTIRKLRPRELRPATTTSVLTGADLKQWRKGKNMSRSAAARLLGLHRRTIAAAENQPDRILGPGFRRAFSQYPPQQGG